MPTTLQMLRDYSDILLQVLSELRGAFLEAAESREEAVELLAAQITDPTSVQMAYEEVGDFSPESREAMELLLKEGGEVAEAQFARQFGGIRQMGPAKLEREMPWLAPESTAELLFYYGLIGRGFKGAGQSAHTYIYIPSDMIPWLPRPQREAAEGDLPLRPIPPPPSARLLLADESLLEDTGTLLGFLRIEGLRITPQEAFQQDEARLIQRLQIPHVKEDPEMDVRMDLLLHLAKRLRWLRRDEQDTIRLTGNPVHQFLGKNRAEQRRDLFEAWRDSPEWNDLCRTPELECTDTGNWKNDPLQTRSSILNLFAQLQPGAWYSQTELIQAIQEYEPDFQRPTGNYDTWYIRRRATQEFLKGFEQWDAVEGALLRFLIRGPLHWLGVLDLAEPSAGDDLQLSLSRCGAIWLGHDSVQPQATATPPMVVHEDFSIEIPHGTPLQDRLRVERFADWQASEPAFTYQIKQRSLKRAAAQGIATEQIVAFLHRYSQTVPAKVETALSRFDAAAHMTQ